jgi:hypothetical protein
VEHDSEKPDFTGPDLQQITPEYERTIDAESCTINPEAPSLFRSHFTDSGPTFMMDFKANTMLVRSEASLFVRLSGSFAKILVYIRRIKPGMRLILLCREISKLMKGLYS